MSTKCPTCDLDVLTENGAIGPHLRPSDGNRCDSQPPKLAAAPTPPTPDAELDAPAEDAPTEATATHAPAKKTAPAHKKPAPAHHDS